MNYKKFIENFIDQLFLNIGSKQKIYFFKGFSKEFYDQLMLYQNFPRFTDLPLMNIFNENIEFKNYMISLMTNKHSLCWGTYEELLAISEVVPNLSHIFNGEIEVVNNSLYNEYYESYSDQLLRTINNLKSENADTIYDTFYSDYKIFESNLLVEYILKHKDQELGLPITERDFFNKEFEIEISNTLTDDVAKITEFELNQIVFNLTKGTKNRNYILSPNNYNESYLRTRLSILNYVFQDQQIHFYIGKAKRLEKKSSENHLPYFQKYWGQHSKYRNALFYKDPDRSLKTIEINQGEIISDILMQCEICRNEQYDVNNSSDVIVTAPTGSGKSLFFQVPGIVLHEKYNEITIVITPLQALMRDQVEKLHERGISFATFLNSEISFEERKARIEGIHNGEYSIIYLSPELLLSSTIEDFIGDRRIGLFVIDEAHLVTSWGRDFRVDYWFLGEFLNKLREGSYYSKSMKRKFPVLILTATAIYGGEDDEIGELIKSLHLNCDKTEHMYLGYNRKENIHFEIVPHHQKGNKKDPKEDLVLNRISQFIYKKEKTIIYCPYTKQVDELYNLFVSKDTLNAKFIGKYHGKLTSTEKEITYQKFKANEIVVMLATKAFGMGIDIDDIQNVYHFAPTGTLADYVQEIGRAARQLENGYAIMDYLVGKDTRYMKTLWGLGGIKQYQIKEIANILYKTYRKNNKRKLLISPETFSHIFDSHEVDAKVKSGLMLLTNDLLAKAHFKAITIKPKTMYTNQYISLPSTIKDEFLKHYGKYVTPVKQVGKTRTETGFGNTKDVKITLLGDIYDINLGVLWEEQFNYLTFGQFKYQFFNNELFDFKDRIIPKMKLSIDYSSSSYEEIKNQFIFLANSIQKAFLGIARTKNLKEFTFNEFYELFISKYEQKTKPKKEFVRILLEIFCFEGIAPDATSQPIWKFVQKRKKLDNIEYNYKLVTKKYIYVANNLIRFIGDFAPNSPNNTFTIFINIPNREQENRDFKLLCATILQLFELATYEIQGGKNPQIFVQINDPYKLSQIAHASNYRNDLLQAITKKHEKAVTFMNQFLSNPFTDEERWDIIENFFLGRNEVVEALLNKHTLVH